MCERVLAFQQDSVKAVLFLQKFLSTGQDWSLFITRFLNLGLPSWLLAFQAF